MKLKASLALAGIFVLSFACTDNSTEPAGHSATVSVSAEYMRAPGMVGDGAPINRIRLTARNDATGAVVETVTADVTPAQSIWQLAIPLPTTSSSLRTVISIELINVTNGVESVEWSGRSAATDVAAGSNISALIPVYRGPLDNLLVTGLTISGVRSGLLEGDTFRVSADVSTSGAVPPQIFWSSGAPGVFAVDSAGRVTTLLPGAGYVYAAAGSKVDSAAIVVAARPASVAIFAPGAALDFLGAEATFLAEVRDRRGAAIAGVPVTWTVADPAVARHLGNGRFAAVSPGSTTVTAQAGNPPVHATTMLTVTQRPANVSVSPDSAVLSATNDTVRFHATVTDAGQNPIPQAQVTWTSTATWVATVDGSGLVSSRGDGVATIVATAGTVSGSSRIRVQRAPAALHAAAGATQSGTVSLFVATRPSVRAVDASGAPVAGVAVTFAVQSGGGQITGASAVTDDNGLATVGSWQLGHIAGTNTLTATAAGLTPVIFTAMAGADQPSVYTVVSGGGQSAPAGRPLPAPITVALTDQHGNPSANAEIRFTVLTGGGVVSTETARTDATGRATTMWTLGNTPGTQTLEANWAGLRRVITANATMQAGMTASIAAGNNQSAPTGSVVAEAPAVRVRDAAGNPVAGVVVTFVVGAGGGTVTGATATTGANGVATVGAWRLGTQPGTNTLLATVPGIAPVTFTATAVSTTSPAQPAHVHVSAGQNQTASAGTAVAVRPAVLVVDNLNRPLAGIPVTFAVTGGGGSATGTSATTNAAGIATVGSWTLGSTPGQNTLTATVAGLPSVTFTATGTSVGTMPPITIRTDGTLGNNLQRSVVFDVGTDNHNGVTVRVVSSDSTLVVVSPNHTTLGRGTIDLFLPARIAATAFQMQSTGAGTGSATLTLSSPGFRSATLPITVVQPAIVLEELNAPLTTLTPDDPFIARIGVQTSTTGFGIQALRPGAEPVTVTFTSSDSTRALLITSNDAAGVVTALIAPTQTRTPESVAAGGVAIRPRAAGTSTISASAPGFTSLAEASRTVTITQPVLTIAAGNVGAGLQRANSLSLDAPIANAVSVRLTSSDPARLLLSTSASVAGSAFIDIPISSGSVTFYTQGIQSTAGATVNVVATAPGIMGDTVAVAVVMPAIDLQSVPSSMTTATPPAAFRARIGLPDAGNNFVTELQTVRPGHPGFNVTITTSMPAVADLVTTTDTAATLTLVIGPQQNTTPPVSAGGVSLRPRSVGTTVVSATAPGTAVVAFASHTTTVTAAPPPLSLSIALEVGVPVGAGLQSTKSGTLSVSTHGGVLVRVTSTDPSRLLIAPNASTVGAAFTDIFVPNGTRTFTYVVQAIEGVPDTIDVTATSPGIAGDTIAVGILQPTTAIGGLLTSTTPLANDDVFQVYVGIGGVHVPAVLQEVRAGTTLTYTVTSSSPAIGLIVNSDGAAATRTGVLTAGRMWSPEAVSLGGVAFRPVSVGTTQVSVTIPGFVPLTAANQTVTIGPVMLMLNGDTVGSGLQTIMTGRLSTSDHRGVTLRMTSSNPSLALLSYNSSPAAAFVDVPIAAGQSLIHVTVQGLENVTGSVTVTASAPGATDGSATVQVVQPFVDLTISGTTFSTISPHVGLIANVGIVAGGLFELQEVRADAPAKVVTITSSDPAVAQLLDPSFTSHGGSITVTIPPGSSRSMSTPTYAAWLDPLAPGVTTVSASAPGSAQTSNAVRTITVTQPTMTLSQVTVGAGLQRTATVTLSGADHGGTTLRITSTDASRLLVSPDAATPGTAFIDIAAPNGQTNITYYVHGMDGTTGPVSVTAAATGFATGAREMIVAQPAFDIADLSTITTASAPDDPFTVRVGLANAANTSLGELQERRAGAAPLTVSLTSSDPSRAALTTSTGTGGAVTINVAPRSNGTATTVAAGGVALDALATGASTITATIAGFRVLPVSSRVVQIN